MHALDKLNERYGNRFRYADIKNLKKNLKRNLYYELVSDFIDRDRIIILTYYKKLPMKLVYNKKTKNIVTVLPLDVDEFNKYSSLIPKTGITRNTSQEAEVDKISEKFRREKSDKELKRNLKIKDDINDKTLYARKYKNDYILLWCYATDACVSYQIFTKNNLQKALWSLVIESFKENNMKLLLNLSKLYSKIFK